MNLTNKQLKRIIREELDLFGEQGQGQKQPTTPTAPQRANVKRVSKKLDNIPGLDELLAGLKSRQDLVQFIWVQVLQKVVEPNGNISEDDIGLALKALLAQVAKSG